MNLSTFHKTLTLAVFLILVNGLTHCAREKLIQEIDKLSGLDGSFETTDSGFSIKWQINEALLKNKDAGLFLDKTEKKDGSQSLKLQVRQTGTIEKFPGISTSLAVMPDKKYRLSFWLKNNASFSVNWKSLAGSEDIPGRLGTAARSAKSAQNWTAYADTISTEPGESRLQLEFILTKPGELWIDNVMFEELDEL